MTIVLCDACGMRAMTTVIRGMRGGEFCSMKCAIAVEGAADACSHEENIDGTTHTGRRLICRDCGYDRIEEQEVA